MTLATQAVSGGKVHVNGDRVKPAHNVRVGDRGNPVTAFLDSLVVVFVGWFMYRAVTVYKLSDLATFYGVPVEELLSNALHGPGTAVSHARPAGQRSRAAAT